ncbi:Uncharacterised protein [Klebsiella pneumoniae]|uniref:Uncharacterized protein n=1 Tax=Klebsiella pneumoniae TaxID=573 RepID=A0A377TQ64_KLEPN|nr:Uncharacterised protein [Klebsiella pneumoniae]
MENAIARKLEPPILNPIELEGFYSTAFHPSGRRLTRRYWVSVNQQSVAERGKGISLT